MKENKIKNVDIASIQEEKIHTSPSLVSLRNNTVLLWFTSENPSIYTIQISVAHFM